MIDSHCHLDLNAFRHDLSDVLQRALREGIERLHIPGTTSQGWERQCDISAQFSNLIRIDNSFGLHPYFLTSDWLSEYRKLEHLFEYDKGKQALALGEIGLDGVIDVPFYYQEKALAMQLNLAKSLNLPVVLHHRKTHHQLMHSLKLSKFSNGGIVHAFSGSIDTAQQYIDRGFLLGIGGTITYERARKTKETIRRISLKHLVLETDSPDMPINGYKGQRNEPSRLPLVVSALSELKQESVASVVETCSANYRACFGLNALV